VPQSPGDGATRLGRGEYKYFAYPLPAIVSALRTTLYPRLAPLANRWNEAMAIAVRYSDRHADFIAHSHEAGQTRPSTEGNGIVRLKIRVDSRKLPSAFCLRKPGMSIWLGHLFWHGGRQYAL